MWFPNLQVHTHTCTPQDKRERCLLRCLPEMKFYDWSKIIFNSQKKSENKSQIKTNYVMFHLLKWKNISIRNSFSRNWNKVLSTKVNENKHKKYLKKSQEFLLCTKVISDQTTGGNVNW